MGITRQQALDCFASDDLIGIGMEADALRRTLHPEAVVTYTIDRLLPASNPDLDASYASARESVAMGATGLHLPPVTHQPVTLDHFESLFRGIKQRFPQIQLHGLSATQIVALAAHSQISIRDTLERLRDAGLDCLAGTAVILNDEIRKRVVPDKCNTADWLAVHRTAHQLGLPTKATMIFGVGETFAERIDHLELLRALQAETGGFTSFTPLAYSSTIATEPTAVEYLTTLAISRLYLDNIPNLQGSWDTQGLKVLQMGLRFGGNDVGSVLLEDRINKPGSPASGLGSLGWKPGGATEEELRRIIREAGFKPVQRDTLYRTLFLN